MKIFEAFKSIAYNIAEETKSRNILTLEYYDKFITWIVGFSITLILLFLSNFNNIKELVPEVNLILLKYSLFSSILFGVLYRYMSFELRIKYTYAIERLKQQYPSFSFPNFETKLDDIKTYDDLKFYLKSDFDYVLNLEVEESKFHDFYEFHRKSYLEEYKLSEKYFKDSMKIAFELNDKNISNPDIKLNIKNHACIARICLVITNISFLMAVLCITLSLK